MLAYDEFKFWQYPFEEIEKYCLFDEYGSLIGVKKEAPTDFKEMYEEYEKKFQNGKRQALMCRAEKG